MSLDATCNVIVTMFVLELLCYVKFATLSSSNWKRNCYNVCLGVTLLR